MYLRTRLRAINFRIMKGVLIVDQLPELSGRTPSTSRFAPAALHDVALPASSCHGATRVLSLLEGSPNLA
jgi:hypothetical protein